MSLNWRTYRRRQRRSLFAAIAVSVFAAVLMGTIIWFFVAGQFAVADAQSTGPETAPVRDAAFMKEVTPPRAIQDASATEVLALLEVKGRAPSTGYNRENFGQAWLDVDRNGCDTRNDVLRRDFLNVSFTKSSLTSKCQVASGLLSDPYTGTTILFERGSQSSKSVQIDHVVALSDAWQTGAQLLTPGQRASLANDPVNLIAVDGPANQEKSASDAASWLPSNKRFRCHYVARQISVKFAYHLWVTPAEHDAMAAVLNKCPAQRTVHP
ncbi:HNH endonuclease family protein [Pseudarthrobacter sp. J1738]|uniref:HNH endonuclease family protein n=1 Tax=Pseudarthrobacter sp. J1738 TaxID=3420446 RepID=UPI003D28E7A3